jgi:hypothetical protein
MARSQATPVTDLTSLADYFPENTLVFASARTDSGYVEELDSFLVHINANLGGKLPSDISVVDALDQFSFSATGRSFDRAFGAWLGDSVAVGLTDITGISNSDDASLMIAAEITDRDAATEFLVPLVNNPVVTETPDYTFYAPTSAFDRTFVLIADNVVLFGNTDDIVSAFEDGFSNLSGNAMFGATQTALPNGDYNIFAYIDIEGLTRDFVDLVSDQVGVLGGMDSYLANAQSPSGAISVGFTAIDERNLVMDMAVVLSDEAMAMQADAPGNIAQSPIDPDFARHIPADAQLVVHDNGFGPEFLAVFDALNALGPAFQEIIDLGVNVADQFGAFSSVDPLAEEIVRGFDISVINFGGVLKNYAIQIFAGFTGMHLEDDVLSWMTGDYATFLRVLPLSGEIPFTIDGGFVTTATDPAQAGDVVSGLARAAELYELDFEREDIGGDALVLTAPIRGLLNLAGLSMDDLLATPEFDVIVGANDDVFVVGTRAGAKFALDSVGDSLLDDPAYAYAADTLFLDDTLFVWYIGTSGMVNAVLELEDEIGSDAGEIAAVLSQLESATITGNQSADGRTSVVRMSLTIPESVDEAILEPLLPPTATPTDIPIPPTIEPTSTATSALPTATATLALLTATMTLGLPTSTVTVTRTPTATQTPLPTGTWTSTPSPTLPPSPTPAPPPTLTEAPPIATSTPVPPTPVPPTAETTASL